MVRLKASVGWDTRESANINDAIHRGIFRQEPVEMM
jgi:hypothetical protein